MVVPMMLLIPILASSDGTRAIADVSIALGKALAVVAVAWFMARYPIPYLLRRVDASRSREIFLLSVLAICIGTAWVTYVAGLSPALGAFLGGMVVADTDFQHRAMSDVIPLRDTFVSLFFISLGMLFQGAVLVEHPVLVAALFLAFVAGKATLATLAAMVMRFPARAAILAGIGLGQFGEFGFVLMKVGTGAGLADGGFSSALLQAGILSMFVTPIAIALAPHLTAGEVLLAPLSRLLGVRGVEEVEPEALDGHVIVVGFGLAGQTVASALDDCGIPYIVLELNSDTVRRAREAGIPIYYADATSHEALSHAHITKARAVAVLINDRQAVIRVVDAVHREVADLPIVVRTRYMSERKELEALGAADVVSEEVEASAEAVVRLLRRLQLPRNVIEAQVRLARDEMGTSQRKITVPRISLCEHEDLAELKIDTLLIQHDWPAVGKTATQVDLRRLTGASVVAVRRGDRLLQEMGDIGPFQEGDLLFLVGNSSSMREAQHQLEGSGQQAG